MEIETKLLIAAVIALWFMGAIIVREWLHFDTNGSVNEDWVDTPFVVRYLVYALWFVIAIHCFIFNIRGGERFP